MTIASIPKTKIRIALLGALSLPALLSPIGKAQPAQAGQAAAVRKIGAVKSMKDRELVLKPDSGADVSVTIQDSTHILRLAPGQTDLKSATPMKMEEVQVGDRMLVRGAPGSEPDSVLATTIIVMKQADVAAKQQQDIQDWQKRGVGGIVTAVDQAAGSITVSVTPSLNYLIKTSPNTSYLRYAPGSFRFSDAQKGTFDQVKVGDQLRARGDRSGDGKELAAEEVISGTFRNVAGTVTAVDAEANTVTVKDVIGKKTVVVKITPNSQMRQMPAPVAQRLAFFLKGSSPAAGAPAAGSPSGSGPGRGRPSGSPDFQQMVGRLPAVALADLKKDDAVMIVCTAGTGSEANAITLLSGVEPILTASPNGMSVAALVSGWNLSAPGGDAGPQ